MAAPNPYSGDPTVDFDPTISGHWKEVAANTSPNGPAMFSRESGEASVVGLVPVDRVTAACRYMLGYAAVTGSVAPFALARTAPVAHPKYGNMICRSVADEEFKVSPSSGSIKRTAGVPVSGARTLVNRTRYQTSKLTLRFEPAMWPLLEDAYVTGEWNRWCYVNMEPRTEILSLDGFTMKYFEGTGLPAGSSSPSGQQYPSDIGQVIVKSDLQVVWKEVPSDWIMATAVSGGIPIYPTKIISGLGCVNSTNWNGFLKGTLLLNGVKLTRHPWALAAGTESRYIYTVEFLMSYFDPPKGYTGAPTPVQLVRVDGSGVPTDPRGHNCFPWKGNLTAGDVNAGRWFAASYTGNSADKKLYQEYAFANLFDCARNP